MADQNIRLQIDKLLCEGLNSLCICIAPAIVDPNIMAIPPAEFLKPLRNKAMPLRTSASLSATAMSTPSRRIRSGCCALAENGQTAAPPRTVMNSRRFIAYPEAQTKASYPLEPV